MTAKQENEVVRFAKWSIGISLTIALAVVSMKIAEVKNRSEFEGYMKNEMINLKSDIQDIKKSVEQKTEETSTKELKQIVIDSSNDIDNIEMFMAVRFGYKPILRGISKI